MVKKALKQDCRDLAQLPTNDVAPCPPVIDHKLKVNNIIVQSLLSTMYTGVPLMTDIT